MTGRIYAVAINTFREAVRDRVLYGVLAFGVALLLFTLAIAELSLEQQGRVIMDVGLASISILSTIVAVFLGSSLLYKEIERKTLYLILPRPIRRWEFLVGKYFGIVLTGAVFVAIMGAIQCWLAAVQAGADGWLLWGTPLVALALLGVVLWRAQDRTAVLVPWTAAFLGATAVLASTAGAEVEVVLASLMLNVGELGVVAAVALLFSSFSTPFLTGLFTLGLWVVGRSADDMAQMRSSTLPEELRNMLHVAAEIVPNTNLFVPGRHALVTTLADYGGCWSYVAQTMAYGVLYAAVMLALAAAIFRKRDLT